MGDPESLQDLLTRSPLLLTPVDAAKILRIGRTTVYALMKAGQLRPVHIGRSCRLPRTEVERYVLSLATPPDTAGRRRANTLYARPDPDPTRDESAPTPPR